MELPDRSSISRLIRAAPCLCPGPAPSLWTRGCAPDHCRRHRRPGVLGDGRRSPASGSAPAPRHGGQRAKQQPGDHAAGGARVPARVHGPAALREPALHASRAARVARPLERRGGRADPAGSRRPGPHTRASREPAAGAQAHPRHRSGSDPGACQSATPGPLQPRGLSLLRLPGARGAAGIRRGCARVYTRPMTVELLTEAPLAPPAGLGPYRREDYDALPDQPRCELLYGRLYVTPSPTLRHQLVALFLWRHLESIAEAAGGFAYGAPLDTVLADHSVVQPDVIYVSATRLDVLGKRIEGAPDLVVEVLSPGSARHDRGGKLRLYAEAGVREYWIVDPETRHVEFLVNEDGRFVVSLPDAGVYRSEQIPEIHLDVAAFWREVERRYPPGK